MAPSSFRPWLYRRLTLGRKIPYKLRLQYLRPFRRLQLARIGRHRQQTVVADRPGQLDQLEVIEPLLQRFHGRRADPVLVNEIAREIYDLRVLRGEAARVLLADRGDRRLGHALLAGLAGLGAPHVSAVELPRDG